MDDMRAVMDAAGSERAAVFGASEGGNMSRPVRGHVPRAHPRARHVRDLREADLEPDYPWAPTPEERAEFFEVIERDWAGLMDISDLAPSIADDPASARWCIATAAPASPGAALALARMNTEIDVRSVLPTI